MFSSLIKAFVATTLLGNTTAGKAASGIVGDLMGSFLNPKQQGASGTSAVKMQGAIEPSVFSFKDDVMDDDITVVDAVDLNSKFTSTQTQNSFPLGNKSNLSELIRDPVFRRFMENAHTNNAMKTVSSYRDLTAVMPYEEETPISINNPTLIT